MTQEDIIAIYRKVYPTGYEPITIERMIRFARLIEEKVKNAQYGSLIMYMRGLGFIHEVT